MTKDLEILENMSAKIMRMFNDFEMLTMADVKKNFIQRWGTKKYPVNNISSVTLHLLKEKKLKDIKFYMKTAQ